jgi:hypothetical protein
MVNQDSRLLGIPSESEPTQVGIRSADMLAKDANIAVSQRMDEIREIAKGIYDEADRKSVLDLVQDYEKLALPKG